MLRNCTSVFFFSGGKEGPIKVWWTNTSLTWCVVSLLLSASSNLSIWSYTAVVGMCWWMQLGISVVELDSLLFAIVVLISKTLLYDIPWSSLFIIFTNTALPVRDLMANGRTCLVTKKASLLTTYNMFWRTEFIQISFLKFVIEKCTGALI